MPTKKTMRALFIGAALIGSALSGCVTRQDVEQQDLQEEQEKKLIQKKLEEARSLAAAFVEKQGFAFRSAQERNQGSCEFEKPESQRVECSFSYVIKNRDAYSVSLTLEKNREWVVLPYYTNAPFNSTRHGPLLQIRYLGESLENAKPGL